MPAGRPKSLPHEEKHTRKRGEIATNLFEQWRRDGLLLDDASLQHKKPSGNKTQFDKGEAPNMRVFFSRT